jgi:hypothetical protein
MIAEFRGDFLDAEQPASQQRLGEGTAYFLAVAFGGKADHVSGDSVQSGATDAESA